MDPLTAASATDYGALKALAPLAVPAIKTAIENWLAPAIERFVKSKELGKLGRPDQLVKVFEEYLLRTYVRLSFMNTIVFGNQQKRIQDLYIPLTVRSSGGDKHQILINGWREDFIPAFKRVVVTDTAGMGKSTILKWLFLCSLGVCNAIPMFIELRTLSGSKGILEKIHDDLCPIDKPFDRDLLLQLLKAGQFIFFLDGFDEIAFEDRQAVTEDIQNFISKAFDNLFIIASRHETALNSFGEFREFTIKPLSKSEAFSLLRKYDETLEHAEALIAELKDTKYAQLKDLMTNPMLVSLLYKAYSYKPKVPFKKHIFYRQVFDALFDMHDSTKGGAFVRKKQSNLDIDEFHLVMRDLGFTTAKLGKIEYEKDEIVDLIKGVRERNASVLFQPHHLLADLVTTVPLFNREGTHYKWAHKSVQDYFASQFIAIDAKENETLILERIYDGGHSRRFENILDLLHDTDNKSFRRVLLRRLLREYIDHHETEYTGEYRGVSAADIETRKQYSFGQEVAFIVLKGDPNTNDLNSNTQKLSTLLRKSQKASSSNQTRGPLGFYIHRTLEGITVIVGVLPTRAEGMLGLLANKKYPYVSKKMRDLFSLTDLPVGKPLIVTDNPTAIFNHSEHFCAVNGILSFTGFGIVLDKARIALKSIEEETDGPDKMDQMLQNL